MKWSGRRSRRKRSGEQGAFEEARKELAGLKKIERAQSRMAKRKQSSKEQRKWKEELDQLRTELERAQRRGELRRRAKSIWQDT
jgi:hypothetical protein